MVQGFPGKEGFSAGELRDVGRFSGHGSYCGVMLQAGCKQGFRVRVGMFRDLQMNGGLQSQA